MDKAVRFGVLGGVRAQTADGAPVGLGGPRRRAVLAALIADAGQVVGVDRLAHRTWRGDPPPSATGSLQAYVSQLRRLLDPGGTGGTGGTGGGRAGEQVIVTVGEGYLLRADPEEIDVTRLGLLVRRAEELLAAGRPSEALAAVDGALDLWRGEPYPDLDADDELAAAVAALREQRWQALDLKARALLLAGRTAEAAALAESLVAEQPLRERYWEHLMLAAHRDGRTGDALNVYRRARATLDAELGIEPGPGLRELHTAILKRDPALEPAVPVTAGPFVVGRDRELALLDEALGALAQGRGGVVVLEGEPGIGKTHVAEAVHHLARERGHATTWAAAVQDLGAPSLWPWEQTLVRLGRPMPAGPVADTDPATARFRLCEEVAATLATAAGDRPLLVVLDDLQWADDASLQTLRLLGRRLRETPLLVLATLRTGEAHHPASLEATLAALTHRRVRLAPFSAADVQALVERQGTPQVDSVALHTRTGGNAFYVAELLRLLDEGADIAEIPDTVRLIIEQRYLRFPQPTRQLLRLAALAGASLDLPLLAHCAGHPDTDTVSGLLEPALAAGLLRHDVETWSWRFAHDLARESLIARLGPQERARLHGVLADAIEALHGPGAVHHLDDLARHRFHAAHGVPDESAYEACSTAADHAHDRLAHDQAARHRERALALLGPGDPRRHGTLLRLAAEHHLVQLNDGRFNRMVRTLWSEAGDDVGRLTATAALSCVPRLWHWRGDNPQASRTIVATIERLLTDTTDLRHRVDLLGALAMEACSDDEFGGGEEYSAEAVRIARTLGDVPLLGRALNLHVFSVWRPGNNRLLLELTEEALAHAGAGLPGMTEFIARTHRLTILLTLGRLDEYAEELHVCRRLAARLSIPSLDDQVVYQRICALQLHARWDDARDLIAAHDQQMGRIGYWLRDWGRLVQLAGTERVADRPVADLLTVAGLAKPVRSTAALAVAEAGDHDRARRLAAQWRLDRILTDQRWYTDCVAAELGELAVLTGVPDRSMIYEVLLAQRGQLVVHSTGMRCTGPVDLVLARLAHTLDRPGDAAVHLRDAGRYEHVPGFGHLFARARDELAR